MQKHVSKTEYRHGSDASDGPKTIRTRIKRLLVGPPRNLEDRSVYRHISLIAFLAWVGLGADGLSSSSYGPEQAFGTLRGHTYLVLALAVLMAATVYIISAAYSRIIEQFPTGGGGYGVTTKLLGARAGVVSGGALLVDYVLTITISVAAAGDAIYSLLPGWQAWKFPTEIGFIVVLLLINLRGVRESVLLLTPIFLLFVITHVVLIGGGIFVHASGLPEVVEKAGTDFSSGLTTLGFGGMALLFVHAYSLGGGTYTGIEAVSNGVSIMREPRVQTAKRTMVYMATSLAFTATGLLISYLLWDIPTMDNHDPNYKTMNALLTERFVTALPFGGGAFLLLTLLSEGAVLVVAAQAGFLGGPRMLANMAIDSWVPRRFGALSERLTTQNGIVLMGLASLAALIYTGGNVDTIVVMYSINVFLTFSLAMLAMLRFSWKERKGRRRIALFAVGLTLCATILAITVFEKFTEGGWVTLLVTSAVVLACFVIRAHYRRVTEKLSDLYRQLMNTPRIPGAAAAEPDPKKPVAAVLVSGYGGLGLHTFLSVFRSFPDHFKGIVFVSAGVIDSREFKGEGSVEALRTSVEENLKKYTDFAHGQGVPATYRLAIGTDAVAEGEKLCLDVSREFPNTTFFAGKVLFEKERWYQNILHNETAFALQKRLQWAGKTVVVVPARLT